MKFPIMFENSKVPVWLSKVSPIEIGAISLGLLVFSRGEMSPETKNHETIHYKQWLELLFIGFLILYPLFWVINLLRYRSGDLAYYDIPFEREAYDNDQNLNYLNERKPYAWIHYLRKQDEAV
tara:strand:+ start:674 stop:1042 length:369 start_codon:yes stop_codon:yes gene_type:complete